MEPDNTEVEIGKVSDLKPGEMKQIDVSTQLRVLLVRTSSGEFFATGNKCTHWGAPLAKGTLCGTTVRCPWHGACFNVKTGDIEDAPALDAITSYKLRIHNDAIFLTTPTSNNFRRPPTIHTNLSPIGPQNDKKVVVIGGGTGAALVVETLRQVGFGGSITMLSNEDCLPYDRTKLSKNLNVTPSDNFLRPAGFYTENNIDIQLGQTVTALDVATKTITSISSSGVTQQTKYDYAVISTGGVARRIKAEGWELNNIFTLRYPSDSAAIYRALSTDPKPQSVVIIGTSFIGLEVAAYIKQTIKTPSVVAVGMEAVPFERVLGKEVGYLMQQLHESRGVSFRLLRTLKRFIANPNNPSVVSGVELDNGEILPADCVILGAGIIVATDFLKEGVTLEERERSVIVDEYMQSSAPGVYAIGDVARFPYWDTGRTIRIEHWNVAQQHARVVARNIAGIPTKYTQVPFFWTTQYGLSIRYAGNAFVWDEVLIKGDLDLENKKFVAYFVSEGKAVAVVTLGADPIASAVADLLLAKKLPSPQQLKENPLEYPLSLL